MAAPLECPEIESLQALLGDTLPPEQRECYERHLESCPTCQERLDRIGDGGDNLRMLGRELGDPTSLPDEAALVHVVERLREANGAAPPVDAADLYFLRPSELPGMLGTLGEYEVLEVIGQGGMGAVLKAYEPALNRYVAIKVMAAAVAGSATARLRFTREARAAAAVCHEHVVAVHGVGEADSLPYLVMQYIAGESLQERLDRCGPLEVEEAVRIGYQTAAGLAAAHAQGLIHRDVKPANLLLENGLARVKITDFGLARMADDAGLTRDGVVAGTPEYMAPEQARGEPVDHRADLYSLGAVLYACCTGRPPFRGSTALAVLRRVNDEEPAPVRARNPEAPAWLEALIARLLAKDPAERIQSAAEVAALLEGYLAHLRQPATASPPPLPPPPAGSRARPVWRARPRRFWQSAWPALLLFLAALGVFGWLVTHAPAPPPPAKQPALPTSFSEDFRGRPPVAPLDLFGGGADSLCRTEDGGLRIILPAVRPKVEPVGTILTAPVSGNFEITAGYELLKVDPLARPGAMAGLEFYLMTATPTQEAVGFYRAAVGGWGDVFQCNRMTYEGGKRRNTAMHHPATSKAGRLRLTRQGSEVTFWAADGPGADFQELCRYDLGRENLCMVRLAAYANTAHPVDLRLTDLRIRAEGLDIPQDAGAGATAEGGSERRAKSWLTAVGIIGLLITLAFLGVWFLARRGRRAAGAAPPGPDTAVKPAAAAPPLELACPGCGHGLKVKAELAGKKGKCPKCGGVVVVPAPVQDAHPGGAPS